MITHQSRFPILVPAASLADGRDGGRNALHRGRHGASVSSATASGLDSPPLGIAILVLVVIRLVNRLINPPPPLPDTIHPSSASPPRPRTSCCTR